MQCVTSDECSPNFTYCCRSVRYERSQLKAPPSTPNCCSSRPTSTMWLIVSKAADRSRPTSTVAFLSSAAAYTVSKTCRPRRNASQIPVAIETNFLLLLFRLVFRVLLVLLSLATTGLLCSHSRGYSPDLILIPHYRE